MNGGTRVKSTAYLVALIQLEPKVDVHFGIFSEPSPTTMGSVVSAVVLQADGNTFTDARHSVLSHLRQEMAGVRGRAIRERLVHLHARDIAVLDEPLER